MKTVTEIDSNHLQLQFTGIEKDEFFNLLEQIKAIKDRVFNARKKTWTIPKTDTNVAKIKAMGFEFEGLTEITESIDIEVTNNLIYIKTNYTVLASLIKVLLTRI